jgi:hypothetical protein
MPDTQLYRAVPAIPVAPQGHEPTPVEARDGEITRMRASVASLRNERLIEQPARTGYYSERTAERREAVALTSALHGHGTRSTRNPKRRSSSDGTIGMRFVFFEPPAAR